MHSLPDSHGDRNHASSLLSGVLVLDQTQSIADAAQTAQLLETLGDVGPSEVVQQVWCWRDVRVLLATTLN